MSKSIFTEQQMALLKEAKRECVSCKQKTLILRTAGFPNEMFEMELESRLKTIEAAEQIDKDYQSDNRSV